MDIVPEPPHLPRYNVDVVSLFGAEIAGIWQYGTLTWEDFYKYLNVFLVMEGEWALFKYDPPLALHQHRVKYLPGPEIVKPGHYVLLSAAGEFIHIGERLLSPPHSWNQVLDPSIHEGDYRTCGHIRDGKCLITGLQTQTYSHLKVVHIFSPMCKAEWVREDYASKITDIGDMGDMDPTKINSVQNLITLRSDLGDAWNNYEFGVDPNNNYRITAFTNGNGDIDGLYLQLDHVQDPNLCPLDELFIDHFTQCILKHVNTKPDWAYKGNDGFLQHDPDRD